MKEIMTAVQREVPNILIVDDTPANLQLLTEMLRKRGYRIRPVPSGKLAIQAAHKEKPDLILLDVNMPEMNGYEVCEYLKADKSLQEIPVLFISALNETIDKIRAFDAGGVDYITKPFQFEEVKARVQTHLNLRHLQVELQKKNDLLKKSYDQLRQLEGLRDNLTQMIVHDLRSPLSCIMMGLELHQMQVAAKLTEAEMQTVKAAALAASRLLEMISSLLDISRLESAQMPLNIEECDLTALTREVIKSLKALKPNCRLSVMQQDAVKTQCDRELMRRVLANIGANALKFVPDKGTVSFDIQKDDKGTKVLIIDNGPGIPKEYHEKIFEKFGQAEIRQEKKMFSTGLGLTFCKLVVEAHRGKIGVESEVNKGSTFWFTLPG